jgi:branched-subunit amino acid transport protein
MAMNDVWFIIGGLAAGTFVLKAAGSMLLANRTIPDRIAASLKYIPIAAMAAVIAPAVFTSAEHTWSVRASEKVIGLLIAFAVHRRMSSTWMTILSGILALELMKMVC